MFELKTLDQRLCLAAQSPSKLKPIFVDFLDKSLSHRRKYLLNSKDGLVKAVHHKHKKINILDTTAGMGQDSFLLASLGHQVVMLERNPTVAALLKDGLTRAAHNPAVSHIIANLKLVEADSKAFLQHANTYDVIYCDPMFPASTKARLPKKEMQALSQIVGADQDSAELITMALTKAPKVVVKRPRLAPPILPNPHHQYSYQACRFDIYIK